MNIIIAITTLVICLESKTISGDILAAITAPWCVEFALGAWVKIAETKNENDKTI